MMDDEYSEENNNEKKTLENFSNNENLKNNQNSSLDHNSTSANYTNGLLTKKLKFDEIPIKPTSNNFLELLEKNLENLEANEDFENYDDDINCKPKFQYEPRKKREIKFDFSKQKKYKYYAQKFDKNFGKDGEGGFVENFESYAETNKGNIKGYKGNNKGVLKYDKFKNNSTSCVARDANKVNHNTKKDNPMAAKTANSSNNMIINPVSGAGSISNINGNIRDRNKGD